MPTSLRLVVMLSLVCAACAPDTSGTDSGSPGGGSAGGAAGGTAGGSAGGTAGGSAGGTAGGSAGGTAGGSAGGTAGGSAGGTAGGSAGGAAGGAAGGTAGGSPAPSGLAYSANPAEYRVGLAITPNVPSLDAGGLPVNWSVGTTPLPDGLVLASTGTIVGTPTLALPAHDYRVTAQTSGGSTFADVTIAVYDVPTGLSYTTNPALYRFGTTATPNAPRLDAGWLPVTFALDGGALPSGLTLNTTTGVISGVPNAVTDAGNVRVVAANDAGATSVVVSLAVYALPNGLTYSADPALYKTGAPIVPNVATLAFGGGPLTYTVDGTTPLSAGLTLNASSGVISGTPTATQLSTYHLIHVANPIGATTGTVNIIVGGAVTLTWQPGSISPETGIANFGTGSFNVTGAVKLADDGTNVVTDLCESNTNGLSGTVALADRATGCPFRSQALHAQADGAIALIIIDNVAGSVPPNMYDASGNVTIPVVSVTQAAGQAIKTALGGGAVSATLSR